MLPEYYPFHLAATATRPRPPSVAGAPALAALLESNAVLQQLSLSHNGIDGTGGMQLIDGLALNSSTADLSNARHRCRCAKDAMQPRPRLRALAQQALGALDPTQCTCRPLPHALARGEKRAQHA